MDEYINTLSKSFLEKFSFEGSHNLFLVHQTIISSTLHNCYYNVTINLNLNHKRSTYNLRYHNITEEIGVSLFFLEIPRDIPKTARYFG